MAQGDGISKKSERKIRTMKRILVISWYFPPINSSEGLVTYKLLKNSKYQYDVCMQDSNDSWSYGKNEQLPLIAYRPIAVYRCDQSHYHSSFGFLSTNKYSYSAGISALI